MSHERDLRFRVDKMSASGHELNPSFWSLTGLINSEGYDVRSILSTNITVVQGSNKLGRRPWKVRPLFSMHTVVSLCAKPIPQPQIR